MAVVPARLSASGHAGVRGEVQVGEEHLVVVEEAELRGLGLLDLEDQRAAPRRVGVADPRPDAGVVLVREPGALARPRLDPDLVAVSRQLQGAGRRERHPVHASVPVGRSARSNGTRAGSWRPARNASTASDARRRGVARGGRTGDRSPPRPRGRRAAAPGPRRRPRPVRQPLDRDDAAIGRGDVHRPPRTGQRGPDRDGVIHRAIIPVPGLRTRRRSSGVTRGTREGGGHFDTTVTDDRAIAPAARIGSSRSSVNG